MKKNLFLLASLLLAACSGPEASSLSSSTSLESSSSEISSSEAEPSSSLISSEEEHASSSSSESSSESSDDSSASISSQESDSSISESESDVAQGNWELTSADLPDNPSSGRHYDVSFSIKSSIGDSLSFVGDAFLRGGGSKNGISIDNTIQLSKEEGMITLVEGYASFLSFEVLRINTNWGDFTGTPTVYSAKNQDKTNGEEVELDCKESEDGSTYIYSCSIPYGMFRLANESSNALYIKYIKNTVE